jgi:hypothetical protein
MEKGRQLGASVFIEEDGVEARKLHGAEGGWHNEEWRGGRGH